jgi:hypothetical protein
MFKIQSNPTFDAALKIVGQGREQTLNVTFRHKTRSEYGDLMKSIAEGKTDTADAVLAIVDKWDADAPLSAESVKLLGEHQPGAEWAILTGYGDALTVARKGN